MKPTGVSRPVRRGEPYESVVHGKFVPSCDAIVTCVLPVLCVLLRFLAHCSIEPICVSYGFRKVPLRMQCGPVQSPYGLWNTIRPVLKISMGQIQGRRIHTYGRLSDHERLSTSPK